MKPLYLSIIVVLWFFKWSTKSPLVPRSKCERWGGKEHDLQAQESLGIDLRKKDDFTYENGDFMEYYDQNWGYLTNENGD